MRTLKQIAEGKVKSIPLAVDVLKRCGWKVLIDRKTWGARHSTYYTLTKENVTKTFHSDAWQELVDFANAEIPTQLERNQKEAEQYLEDYHKAIGEAILLSKKLLQEGEEYNDN